MSRSKSKLNSDTPATTHSLQGKHSLTLITFPDTPPSIVTQPGQGRTTLAHTFAPIILLPFLQCFGAFCPLRIATVILSLTSTSRPRLLTNAKRRQKPGMDYTMTGFADSYAEYVIPVEADLSLTHREGSLDHSTHEDIYIYIYIYIEMCISNRSCCWLDATSGKAWVYPI